MKALIIGLSLASLAALGAGCFLQDHVFGTHRELTRGQVSFGFEEAAFRPCGSDEQWWLVGSEIADLQNKWNALGLEWYHPAYAEVKGTHSSKGEYGHLGAYQRELDVHEVLQVRLLKDEECAWPS